MVDKAGIHLALQMLIAMDQCTPSGEFPRCLHNRYRDAFHVNAFHGTVFHRGFLCNSLRYREFQTLGKTIVARSQRKEGGR